MSLSSVVYWTSLLCILIFIIFAVETAEVLRRGTLWTKFSGFKARKFLARSLWLTSGYGLVVLFYLFFRGDSSLEGNPLGPLQSSSVEGSLFSYKLLLFMLTVFFFQHVLVCREFKGRLSGGSDALLFHILLGLCVSLMGLLFPASLGDKVKHAGVFWIAAQLTISYFVAGVAKARHLRWWRGDVLSEVLQSSIYSIPPWLRQLSKYPEVLQRVSVLIIIFELSFPLVWVFPNLVYFYLGIGILFHFGVWMMFGLHRFFWTWICTYPCLIFSIQFLQKGI